jgi:K+-transporting ATPase ATPase C chain
MTTDVASTSSAPSLGSAPAHPVTGSALRRQAVAALRLLLVLTVLLGVLYPLGIWAVSRAPGLHDHAEGSLTGTGSSLIGIDPVPAGPAADPWFHTRPSASATADAGLGPADPTTSGGTNLGPGAEKLRDAVDRRRQVVAAREGVSPAAVPPDAVTASASGLDPHISPAYAALQVPRVARVTGLGEDRVRALVAQATAGRALGFLGEPTVNVPRLDALLHAAAPRAR